MSFKDFTSLMETEEDIMALNEAKFNAKNMRKVSDLLAKIGSKKLGVKFQYAWSDNFKKASGASGTGVRYLTTTGQQIRFNHVNSKNSFTINSVDYWKAGDGFTEPSRTLYFAEGINIVHLKEKLFDAIISGKEPVATAQELGLTESSAKKERANRDAFVASKGLPKSYAGNHKNLIKKLEPLGLLDEYLDYVNIKANDSEKTEFDAYLTTNQKKLDSNSEEYFADPKYVFQDLEEAAKVIAKGHWRSMIIAGMGGIGKTFGVKQVLTKELGPYGDGPDSKWAYYEGLKVSGFGLFKTILTNKEKLIVFDDSDSIWNDKDMVNMMKIVTSDSGERGVAWVSQSTANVALMTKEERLDYENDYIMELMEDPNTRMKAPSKFNFNGSMIAISNMPANKFDDAIKSRSIFIDVYLAQRDLIRRMATIMGFEGDSEEEIIEVLEAIDPKAQEALDGKGKYGGEIQYVTPEYARKNKQMNMRTVGITRSLRRAGAKDWKRMASLYS